MKLVALGPKGTNGHEAAEIAAKWKIFGSSDGKIQIDLLDNHRSILEYVEKHRCIGLVAIENDAVGLVHEVVSYWAHHGQQRTHIIGELTLPIEHQLAMHNSVDGMEHVTDVWSHRSALDQSKEQLDKLGIEGRHATSSTAEAAAMIASGVIGNGHIRHCAALVSPFAAKLHGLKVVKRHMESEPDNRTRFYVLGPKPRPVNGSGERTAVIFSIRDVPCSLAHTLLAIGCDSVNASSMDRVRLGSKARSVFFCEFDVHKDSEVGRNILKRLRTFVAKDAEGRPNIRILGSWPIVTK